MADVEINDLAADTTPAAAAEFEFQNTAGGTSGKVTLANIAANMPAITSASDLTLTSSDLILTSGNGIDFSATANGSGTTTSELFDDYEEGTFTPVLSDGTNTATHAIQLGTYTKIGNRVHFNIQLSTTSLGSVSGALQITGMPFTSNSATNNNNSVLAGFALNLAITAGTNIVGHYTPSTTAFALYLWDSVVGPSVLLDTEWSADGRVNFSGTYQAA